MTSIPLFGGKRRPDLVPVPGEPGTYMPAGCNDPATGGVYVDDATYAMWELETRARTDERHRAAYRRAEAMTAPPIPANEETPR